MKIYVEKKNSKKEIREFKHKSKTGWSAILECYIMGFSCDTGGPPGIGMNPRMNPPRGPSIGPMGPGGYGPAGMRGPPPGRTAS